MSDDISYTRCFYCFKQIPKEDIKTGKCFGSGDDILDFLSGIKKTNGSRIGHLVLDRKTGRVVDHE